MNHMTDLPSVTSRTGESWLAAETAYASIEAVRPPAGTKVMTSVLVALLLTSSLALALIPWQQAAGGKGRVIAWNAPDRQQVIEAPIDARISNWLVREGDLVRQGDVLIQLMDNDPDFVDRMNAERKVLVTRLESARQRATAFDGRILALEGSLLGAEDAAEARVRLSVDRVRAAEQGLRAAEAAVPPTRLNLERQLALEAKGLASVRQVDLARLELTRAETEQGRMQALLTAAKSEEAAARADRRKVGTDARAALQDARASRASAEAEAAAAQAEIVRLDTRLARQQTQIVRSPRDGMVQRIIANQEGSYVRAGEALAQLVPSSGAPAVELTIKGNDVPLVAPGRVVRLQFEGWPAIQFIGWPSVAVGTFPGKVSFIDPSDDGYGQFRIVVQPEKPGDWPDTRYLRPGVRANGWVLLNQVPLGYELWRQFNGFPPVINPNASDKGDDDPKLDPPSKRLKK